MENNKSIALIWIINLLMFFSDIFTIITIVWTKTAIKVLFYIYFSFSCIIFIYYTLMFIYVLFFKRNSFFEKLFNFLPLLLTIPMIFWILEIVLILVNSNRYLEYRRDCPYLLRDVNYNIHYKRRCELYSINLNSRYTYQYICSYDSSKDFNNKLKSKEIQPNKVICVKMQNVINNNYYIHFFVNEYKYETKYYCSRTNLPKKYSFATHKDCENKKYIYIIISYFLIYLKIVYFCQVPSIIKKLIVNDYNINVRNFNRFFAVIRNHMNNTINSTKASEKSNQNRNEEYVKQNTKNIVIENKKEIPINENIKDNIKYNTINLRETNISFKSKSTEKIINNNFDRSNINIIHN